VAHLKL